MIELQIYKNVAGVEIWIYIYSFENVQAAVYL